MAAAIGVVLSGTAAFAGTTWDGGGADANWTTPANWTGDALPDFSPTTLDNITVGTAFGSGTATVLNGSKTVNSLILDGTVSGFTINGDTLTIKSGNITRSGGFTVIGIHSGIVLGNNGVWTSGGGFTISELQINGVVSDGGNNYSITTTGSRPLLFTNVNTYGGGTILNSSTVFVGNDASLGTGTVAINGVSTLRGIIAGGTVNLANPVTLNGFVNIGASGYKTMNFTGPWTLLGNSTLEVFNVGTATIAGSIGDGGTGKNLTIANTGSGTINLSGNNTYTGNTIVNSGVVNITGTNSSTGNLIVSGGDVRLGGAHSVNNGTITITGGGLKGIIGGPTFTLSNAVTLNGSVNIANSGFGTVNWAGPWTLLGNSAVDVGSGLTTFNSTAPIGGNFGLIFNASSATKGIITLENNNTYTGKTILTNGVRVHFYASNSGLTNDVLFQNATAQVDHNNALGTGTIRFIGTANQLTGRSPGGAPRTIGNPVTLDGKVLIASSGYQPLTFTGNWTLLSDSVIDKSHGEGTLAGNISGSFGLTFTNSSGNFGFTTLNITGSNTYTGPTVFTRASTYKLAGGNAIPDNSAVTLHNTSDSLTLDLQGTTERIGSLASSGSLGGNVVLGSGTLITGGNGLSTTYGQVISGSGNLIKEGTGTFTLNGSNTFTGTTTIRAGTLQLDATVGALGGSSQINIRRGGTFSVDNTTANAGRITDTGTIKLLGGEAKLLGNGAADSSEAVGTNSIGTGHSTITVVPGSGRAARLTANTLGRTDNGTALFRGTSLGTAAYPAANVANITFTTAPTLQGAGGGAGTTTISILPYVVGDHATGGSGTDFVTYTANGVRLLNAGAGEYKTSITDGQTQLDNVKLTGGASLSSATTINSLLLGAGGGVSGSATLNLNSGGILAVGGANTGISVPTLAFGANEGVVFALNDLSISSTLTGSGGLTKSGGSTLTLSAASSYTGQTTVNEGTLLFNGSLTADASGVAVRDGATLGGTGTLARAVSVDDGGILSPGNSPGTLTFGSLTLTNASVLNFELGPHNGDGSAIVGGGTNDLIEVNGDLTLDGVLNVTALSGFFDFGASTNFYRLINYTGTLTDNTLVLGSFPAGALGFIDTSVAGQVNLLVIPEPTSVLLVVLAGALALRRRLPISNRQTNQFPT
jgi:fibronectin-binding autotransporter adhesin